MPTDLPKEQEGAPCGIQIMGQAMKDEELVQVAMTVAETLDIKTR